MHSPDTLQAQDFILLRELGHYYGVLGLDSNYPTAQQDIQAQINNNNLLLQYCSGNFAGNIFLRSRLGAIAALSGNRCGSDRAGGGG